MEQVQKRASSRRVRIEAGIRVALWLKPPSSSVSVAEGHCATWMEGCSTSSSDDTQVVG